MAKSLARLLAALAACVSLASLTGTAHAATTVNGLSDQRMGKIDPIGGEWTARIHTYADRLAGRVRYARYQVRWDVATLPDGHQRVRDLDAWLSVAQARGYTPLISFMPREQGSGDEPDVIEYRDAMRAFRSKARWSGINEFTAWNEPNHPLFEVDVRSAVDYLEALTIVCGSNCTVAAGDFSGSPSSRDLDYYGRYVAAVRARSSLTPRYWAHHPYDAVNRETTDAARLRSIEKLLELIGPGKEIWFTEVGAYYCHKKDGVSTLHGPTRQAAAAQRMQALITNPLPGVRTDQNLTRVYYYHFSGDWTPGTSCDHDSGLIDHQQEGGRPRPAFKELFPDVSASTPETDVNGDGYADLVTLYSTGSAYTYVGNANGSLGPWSSSFGGGMTPAQFSGIGHYPIDVGDVNGDGRGDLVTLHSSGHTWTYLGQSNAMFAGTGVPSFGSMTPGILTANGGFEPIAVADATGDGRDDLIVYHAAGRTVWTYPGKADGSFDVGRASISGTMDSALFDRDGYYFLDAADVNGDRYADLVTLHTDGSAYVFPAVGGGEFNTIPVWSFGGAMSPGFDDGVGYEPVALADVNGDGRADLIASLNGTIQVFSGEVNSRLVHRSNSFDGTMPTNLGNVPGHELIGAFDVTGDGHADLVTSYFDGNVRVYPGRADYGFGAGVASFANTFNTTRHGLLPGHELVMEKPMFRRRGCTLRGC